MQALLPHFMRFSCDSSVKKRMDSDVPGNLLPLRAASGIRIANDTILNMRLRGNLFSRAQVR